MLGFRKQYDSYLFWILSVAAVLIEACHAYKQRWTAQNNNLSHGAAAPQPYPVQAQASTRSAQVLNFLPDQYMDAVRPLSNCSTDSEKLIELVKLGQSVFNDTSIGLQPTRNWKGHYVHRFHKHSQNDDTHYERVGGCISTMLIAVKLQHSGTYSVDSDTPTVLLDGAADSLIAKGLLALLFKAFHHQPSRTILSCTAHDILRTSTLTNVLSDSKTLGLVNAIKMMQLRVQEQTNMTSPADSHNDIYTVRQTHDRLIDKIEYEAPNVLHTTNKEGWMKHRGNTGIDTFRNSAEDVAVLLSGGVDSSVAAYKLIEKGYRVKSYYLKVWLGDELKHLGNCPWEEDIRFASEVSKQLGISFETISLQNEYWDTIVTYVLNESRQGRTPNSDILCNNYIKFGKFWDAASARHKYIGSGHYARLRPARHHLDASNATFEAMRLMESADPFKDQTYFLSRLSQTQLKRCLFPIGEYTKLQVRSIAESQNLPTKRRDESQGICFLGDFKFNEFLRHFLGENRGPIIQIDTGKRVGEHKGLWFHTIGQRKGIGELLSPLYSCVGPWYTVHKDVVNNILYVSNAYDDARWSRHRTRAYVRDIHWIAGYPCGGSTFCNDMGSSTRLPSGYYTSANGDKYIKHEKAELSESDSIPVSVKVRHGIQKVDSSLQLLNSDGTEAYVELSKKDIGLAPGQFLAFYQGPTCLGSGVIADSSNRQLLQPAIECR